MPRRHRGITLIEVLVVIAILVLVAALIFPILARSKDAGKTAVCKSNLHQIALAIELYSQSNDGKMSKYIMPIMPYVRSKEVLKCPMDRWGGVQDSETEILGTPVSYYYPRMFLFDHYDGDWQEGWSIVRAVDPTPGVLICPLHGELYDAGGMAARPYSPINSFRGRTLRARSDGSVKSVRIDPVCTLDQPGVISGGRRDWDLVTDKRPCPPRVCGKRPIVECP